MMKCMDCGKTINWDNSYGYSEKTCVCHACMMKRVEADATEAMERYGYPADIGYSLAKLIDEGRAMERA